MVPILSHTKSVNISVLWFMTASENEVLLCAYKTKGRKERQNWVRNVTSAGKTILEVNEQG